MENRQRVTVFLEPTLIDAISAVAIKSNTTSSKVIRKFVVAELKRGKYKVLGVN